MIEWNCDHRLIADPADRRALLGGSSGHFLKEVGRSDDPVEEVVQVQFLVRSMGVLVGKTYAHQYAL